MSLLILLMGFTFAQHSWAEESNLASSSGRETGNGGGAVVCRNGNGVTTHFLDLWEADTHLTIVYSNSPKEVQLSRAVARLRTLDSQLAAQVERTLVELSQRRRAIPTQFRLPPPIDTNINLLNLPRNCSLEGFTRYIDATEVMEVDETLESTATQTDLAARDFHEALYLILRRGPWRATHSMQTRKITGIIFAGEPIVPIPPQSGLEAASHVCEGSGYQFYILPMTEGRVRLQFTQISNRYVIDRTTQDVVLNPQDPNQQRAEFLSRLREGFPQGQHTAPTLDFQGFEMTARLTPGSQLEPAYGLLLNVGDGVSCNAPTAGRFPSLEVCRQTQLRTVYSNFGISIRLAHQPERESTRLTCSALRSRN